MIYAFIIFLSIPSLALAQSKQLGQETTQQRAQDATSHTVAPVEPMTEPAGQGLGNGQNLGPTDGGASNSARQGGYVLEDETVGQAFRVNNQGLETALQNLNQVAERVNNPEIGQQIRQMVSTQQQLQLNLETNLQSMQQRKSLARFLIGPDYKTAKQINSDISQLRNQALRLSQIDPESTDQAVAIQAAVEQLELSSQQLEGQLDEQLTGFSLFGWLNSLINK